MLHIADMKEDDFTFDPELDTFDAISVAALRVLERLLTGKGHDDGLNDETNDGIEELSNDPEHSDGPDAERSDGERAHDVDEELSSRMTSFSHFDHQLIA